MDDPTNISRELSGRSPYPEQGKPTKPPRRTSGQAEKTKAPPASMRSSEVAQRWMDLAEQRKLSMPFNVNWLAHQIAAKVGADARMKVLLREGRDNDVKRWAVKMVEKFWDEWVQASDKPSDISHLFLDQCWDDVRDYAFDCLRAAYLKKHGRHLVPDLEDHDHRQEGLYADLQKARFQRWLEEATSESQEEAPRKRLDDHHREVLRSRRRPEREEDR